MARRPLAPCPASPNCVSTVAPPEDSQHAIAPYLYRTSRAEAKAVLKTTVAGLPRTKLIEDDDTYLHYECTSLLLRFVDDVEFVFDDEAKLIHFRSASRIGYGDLGVNRRRMEHIRSRLDGRL
ncbi:MAG TPA: DUF1499 domain-containing protein [Nitrospira sp.]|nr:DUF1499 domain-containing protein [Nitrospira sp.]